MIRIARPAAPAQLAAGVALRATDCANYDANGALPYSSGARRFSFKSAVYAHSLVKTALKGIQHGKCCYCESLFGHTSYGDVEHYRPKGAWRQTKSGGKTVPGYYWLAYEWSNLYFSCAKCNTGSKGDYFPLSNPVQRALSHHHDIALERPLILDPGGASDPCDHIRFDKLGVKGKTRRGRVTIQAVGLDRPELKDRRLERANLLLAQRDLVRTFAGDPTFGHLATRAAAMLAAAVLPTAEFSAMAQDILS